MNSKKASEEISEVKQQIVIDFPYQSKKQHESNINLAWKSEALMADSMVSFSHSIDFSSSLSSVDL